MKSRYVSPLVMLVAAATMLGACASTDASKQAEQQTARKDSAMSQAAMTDADKAVAEQTVPQPSTASGAVIQDQTPHPIDPGQLPTPSNSEQLPRPDLTQGGAQSGAPASDSPVGYPQGGQPSRFQGGQAPSEMPVGSTPTGNSTGSDSRKSSVETALHAKSGFEKVVVTIGGDGCVTLGGTVRTAQKKEEAAAIARGASGMSCMVNNITVR